MKCDLSKHREAIMTVAGTPANFTSGNVFDWLFSNPFATVNEFTPPSQRLDPIEGSRQIFVDNASGKPARRAEAPRCNKTER
jgi:hypothetical protein